MTGIGWADVAGRTLSGFPFAAVRGHILARQRSLGGASCGGGSHNIADSGGQALALVEDQA
jgi:hypothetical protein